MKSILIADSGSTKTEWCLLQGDKKKKLSTQGLSPYFLSGEQIKAILEKELIPKIKDADPAEVHFYGTGCSSPANASIVKKAIQHFSGNDESFRSCC